MAEAVVTFALEKIHDLLLEKGGLSSRVGDDMKALERQLEEIKGLIEDADRRRHEAETVKIWIAEIRDLAYRAEAAIEIYVARVSSKRRRGAKKLLRRYACILKECRSLHQLDSEIKHIKSGLEVVTKKLLKHGIVKKVIDGGESSGAASDNQNLARKTYPDFKIEDCFVGMEDKLKLLESLIEDKQQPRVISVWGMGGIGKTAIAREVYNKMINQSKPTCFDRFAWVCITQQCQVRSILEDVMRQLDPQKTKNVSSLSSLQHIPQIDEDFSKVSNTELVERLCEVQRANRCLIVLDDLWRTSDQWNYLNHPFLVKDLRSKILVTTRHQDVAAEIGFPVELELLDVDHAWELLQKKAFPYDNIPDFAFQEGGEKLHHIGNEMVQKCGRLPLAISLLGGVLRKKNSMDDWETVNKNLPEYIHPIEGVLNLSYEELPYYLKPCFLYLGILQEDEKMPVVMLYRMWMAQGMISPGKTGGNEETLIEIAENYLSDLVSRCIVQVEVNDVTPMEKFRTCQLHDVVRVLCLLKGEKENFGVRILKYPCGDNRTLLKNKTRYLVVNMEEEVEQGRDHEFTISGEEDTRKHVRSFHIHSAKAIEFPTQGIVDFQRFKMLRDLVIIGFKFAGRKLPRGITNLVHLRSLLLRECELDELPSSIRHLVYLETLDLFHSSNVRIPNALKKMFRLKYLVLPSYFGVTNDNYRLILDEGLGELESLMGFDSRVHELKSAPKMKNLRRFSAYVHDKESLLVITKAIATTWNKLQLCAISIEKGCELREEGWMMLKQEFTCPNLHFLKIHVPLGKLLVECMNNIICSKLVELILEDCEIEDDPMGILGNLPSLRQLCLALGLFVGEEMTCPASSFPHLKTLELAGLPKLREWRVEAGAMRLLSLLYIFDCPHLEMVPDGLSRISTLKKLTISGMPELGKRVTPSGDDFHKVCHVPSIHIHDRSPFTQDEV